MTEPRECNSLDLPGAIPPPADYPDQGVAWHFGNPHVEQRRLAEGQGVVDLSNRRIVEITGADRTSWLHSLTTADLLGLHPGDSCTTLILDPHGHVEHELHVIAGTRQLWLIVAPGAASAVISYLDRMRFMLDVAVADRSEDYAVVWCADLQAASSFPAWLPAREYQGTGATPSGYDRGGDAGKYVPTRPGSIRGAELLVPRAELCAFLQQHAPWAGTWALAALQVAAGMPRADLDVDHRSLPHELGWIGPAVHLSKGCYRGQETVARVHNMGRPPRRLVLLHLDGSVEQLPTTGADVTLNDRVVGRVGSVARHYELGPICLAVVKRNVPLAETLLVDNIAAAQETIVAP